MSDISINNSSVEQAVAELVSRIQVKVKDAGTTSGNAIINAVEHSSGEFINSLKSEVAQEAAIMNSVGDLLIVMANYIQSASTAFANMDAKYSKPKMLN